MTVVRVKNGEVVQTWRDVADVAAAVEKYGLDSADLVEGDYPPGTKWDGATFTAPVPPSVSPEVESPVAQAIRIIAADLGSATVAKVEAVLGKE